MQPQLPRPVVFGEVLFDCFEDGTRTLGGAPFNVAWHLQGFGLAPLMLTRVGRDDAGTEVLRAMECWGMDRSGVQLDGRHPTGTVQVSLSTGGHASYDIVQDSAWDFIDFSAAETALLGTTDWNLLYHGTLAARSPTSRTTLDRLRQHLPIPAFVDVNLRTPWWERRQVSELLENGRWAKLNDDELDELLDRHPDTATFEQLAAYFGNRHHVEHLIVTLGADGAVLVTPHQQLRIRPERVVHSVDTVGAGDAFSAVMIAGTLWGWPPEVALRRAMQFATEICLQRGATASDAALYRRVMEHWKEA